jgi:hypothetical protein
MYFLRMTIFFAWSEAPVTFDDLIEAFKLLSSVHVHRQERSKELLGYRTLPQINVAQLKEEAESMAK